MAKAETATDLQKQLFQTSSNLSFYFYLIVLTKNQLFDYPYEEPTIWLSSRETNRLIILTKNQLFDYPYEKPTVICDVQIRAKLLLFCDIHKLFAVFTLALSSADSY